MMSSYVYYTKYTKNLLTDTMYREKQLMYEQYVHYFVILQYLRLHLHSHNFSFYTTFYMHDFQAVGTYLFILLVAFTRSTGNILYPLKICCNYKNQTNTTVILQIRTNIQLHLLIPFFNQIFDITLL